MIVANSCMSFLEKVGTWIFLNRFGGLSAGPPVKGDVEQEDAKLKRAARFGVSIDDDMRAKRAKRL